MILCIDATPSDESACGQQTDRPPTPHQLVAKGFQHFGLRLTESVRHISQEFSHSGYIPYLRTQGI